MSMIAPPSPSLRGFLEDFGYQSPAPAERSAIEELFDQLHAHEQEEAQSLADYEAAASSSPDAGVKYLMGLVIEDERRHHRLSQAMADEVHQSLQWLDNAPALPSITASGADRDQLLAQTRRFLAVERSGERQLDDLRKRVKALHSGLLELIVELMQMDTKKHIHILKHIEKRLQERF
jgi:hypothetical protein